MFTRRNGRAYECVVIDLNTQRDFCEPKGRYPVVNLDRLIPALQKVIYWVRHNQVPMISSLESHREWEVPRNGRRRLCCIDGTPGQRKIDFTLFPYRICVEVDNTLAVAPDLLKDCQQVIFRKRTDDLLANPKADRFLTHLPAEEFVVIGNGLECSVKALTLGLLARNKRVSVVLDACGYWDAACADLSIRQISAKGARLVLVSDLLSRRLERRSGYAASHPSNGSDNGHHRTPKAMDNRGDGRLIDDFHLFEPLPDSKMPHEG